jgi:hypothetical protein
MYFGWIETKALRIGSVPDQTIAPHKCPHPDPLPTQGEGLGRQRSLEPEGGRENSVKFLSGPRCEISLRVGGRNLGFWWLSS